MERLSDTEAIVVAEIAAVLNKHSQENASDTPDFTLARYLLACLRAYNEAIQARSMFWGDNRKNPVNREPMTDVPE